MEIFTRKEILPISFIILAVLVSAFLYPELPGKIPSHWNIKGEIDAWTCKNVTVLLFPGLTLFFYLLMTFLPLIDPLKKNYLGFIMPYFWFRTAFVTFFVSLYLYSLWASLGAKSNIIYFIIPAISILFIVIGIFLPKVKKNYFVGIRTPWTLYSEEVWNRTHQSAGKFFIAAGIISLFGLFLPKQSFIIVVTAVLAAALISVIYSYFIFRKGQKIINNK